MKQHTVTVKVTKTIVVTVEADNYDMACDDIKEDFEEGEYAHSWSGAEPEFELIEEWEEE